MLHVFKCRPFIFLKKLQRVFAQFFGSCFTSHTRPRSTTTTSPLMHSQERATESPQCFTCDKDCNKSVQIPSERFTLLITSRNHVVFFVQECPADAKGRFQNNFTRFCQPRNVWYVYNVTQPVFVWEKKEYSFLPGKFSNMFFFFFFGLFQVL